VTCLRRNRPTKKMQKAPSILSDGWLPLRHKTIHNKNLYLFFFIVEREKLLPCILHLWPYKNGSVIFGEDWGQKKVLLRLEKPNHVAFFLGRLQRSVLAQTKILVHVCKKKELKPPYIYSCLQSKRTMQRATFLPFSTPKQQRVNHRACLVQKSEPKKCYSTCHVKSYGTCMEY
jgi:hypothetical protein